MPGFDETPLGAMLRRRRVRVGAADENAVILQNVPANRQFFNKSRTNLLVKRPQGGLPFVVGVDEDLEYSGDDHLLAGAFAGATRRQGWRVFFVDAPRSGPIQGIVEGALRMVGFDGEQPSLPLDAGSRPPAADEGLVARYGRHLSDGDSGATAVIVGRNEVLNDVLVGLLQWQGRLPVVAGDAGVGKTHLLRHVASRLANRRPPRRVVAVDTAELFAGAWSAAERENRLATLLVELTRSPGLVLALEHIDLAVGETSYGALLLARALECGARLLGSTEPAHLSRLVDCAPLARHVQVISLREITREETRHVVRALLPSIARHHGVHLDESCVATAVERASTLAGRFPAKAIALIDAAAARAHLSGAPVVDAADVYLAACGFSEIEE